MTPVEALRELAHRAREAREAGGGTLQVDAELLGLAKQAVQAENTYPPELAGIPIFLDAQGLLVIGAVTLYQ